MKKQIPSNRKSDVAILLAAYNGAKWLQPQVESILTQEEVNVTLFVSIDSSSDNTEELFRLWSADDDRIVVLPLRQASEGASNNFFRLIEDVDFSSFDYVGFSDQDDIWQRDKLTRAVSEMAAHGADAYSSNVEAFWESGRTCLINKAQRQKRWDFLFECAGPGSTFLLRVPLMDQIKQTLAGNSSDARKVLLYDWFCYAYARANGFTWYIDQRPGVRYRQHKINFIGANIGWQAFWTRVKTVFAGTAIHQSVLVADLIGIKESAFVQKWARLRRTDMLYLAFNAWHCRRRFRDVLLFFGAFVTLACKGLNHPPTAVSVSATKRGRVFEKPTED